MPTALADGYTLLDDEPQAPTPPKASGDLGGGYRLLDDAPAPKPKGDLGGGYRLLDDEAAKPAVAPPPKPAANLPPLPAAISPFQSTPQVAANNPAIVPQSAAPRPATNLPPLPRNIDPRDVPGWKPGAELPEDENEEVGTPGSSWKTKAQNQAARLYNEALYAAKGTQPYTPYVAPVANPGLAPQLGNIMAAGGLPAANGAPIQPQPPSPAAAAATHPFSPTLPQMPPVGLRVIQPNTAQRAFEKEGQAIGGTVQGGPNVPAPTPSLWLPEFEAVKQTLETSPIPKIPTSPADHNVPVMVPGFGLTNLGTLKTVANTVTGQVTAETAGMMLGAELGAGTLVAIANSPKAAAILRSFPVLARAVDIGSRTAVPATFAATQGVAGVESLQSAAALRAQGKPDQADDAMVAAFTNLVLGSLSAVGAVGQYRAGSALYPPEAGNGNIATVSGRTITPEDVGGIPKPANSQQSAAVAANLQQGGNRLAAQAWQNLDFTNPVEVKIDGDPHYISAPQRVPGRISGRPAVYQSVTDAQGNVVYGGTPSGLRDWLISKQADVPILAGETPLRAQDLQPVVSTMASPPSAPAELQPRPPIEIAPEPPAAEPRAGPPAQIEGEVPPEAQPPEPSGAQPPATTETQPPAPQVQPLQQGAGGEPPITTVGQDKTPAKGEPGWVGNVSPSELTVDAPRFQFKQDVGQKGVSGKLKDVQAYNPERGGILAVWKDPDDGKTYVVNGHHRFELAERTGAPTVAVRYLAANNAQEARLKGALTNISEDQGTSLDAAKVFRDSGQTVEELRRDGLELSGRIASQGLALANLSPSLFRDVVSGDLSPARGAVIGASVPSHDEQDAIKSLVDQWESNGKHVTDGQLAELIRMNQAAPKITETPEEPAQGDIFGRKPEEVTRSLLREKAEVSDYIRDQIKKEKRLFGLVGTQGAADALGQTGNVIRATENAAQSEQASQGQVLYDKLSTHPGPIDNILNRAAQALAKGEKNGEVKQEAYKAVRAALTGEIGKLTGVSQRNGGRVEGLGEEGARQNGSGELDVLGSRKPPGAPDINQESFLSPEEQDASKAVAKSGEDQLLGRQLTAQIASGLAAKPTKLKPAEQRGMFEDEGPEQDTLFSRAPVFFSQLERTIEDKMPAKASPEQIRGIISNPQSGIKPDEIKWTGFDDWLKDQKGPVTKQEALDFLRANQVHVEEVTHGYDPEKQRAVAELETKYDAAKATQMATAREIEQVIRRHGLQGVLEPPGSGGYTAVNDRPDLFGEVARYAGGILKGFPAWAESSLFPAVKAAVPKELLDRYEADVQAKMAANRELYDASAKQNVSKGVKFGTYVTPGGTNQRELLMTLPPKPVPVTWKQTEKDTWVSTGGDTLTGEHGRFEIYELNRPENKYRFKLYDSIYRHDLDFPTLEAAQKAASEARTSELTQGQQYVSPHWDGTPNVLAHLRMNDRVGPNGEKILHVEEVQSDWHQKGRQQGYALKPGEAGELPQGWTIRQQGGDWVVLQPNGEIFGYPETTRERALQEANGGRGSAVPSAPFSKTWHELAFRRILRIAAESGSAAWHDITEPYSPREELQQYLGTEMAAVTPLKIMDAAMLPALKNNKISRAVAKAIPIDVVNILSRYGFSPDQLVSQPNVVGKGTPLDTRAAISRGLTGALELVGTRLRAALDRILLSKPTGRDEEVLPAIRASELNPLVVARLLSPLRGTDLGTDIGSLPIGDSRTGDRTKPAPALGGVDVTGVPPKLAAAQLAEALNRHDAIVSGRTGNTIEKYTPGYEKVSWTPGTVQAERYDLSKQLSSIALSGSNFKAFDHNGNEVISRTGVTPEELPDLIGKEAAERLMAQPAHGTLRTLEGLDLKVGGEGMKGFYDQILPAYANKYGKKWGARVGTTEIQTSGPTGVRQALLVPGSDRDNKPIWRWESPNERELSPVFDSREKAILNRPSGFQYMDEGGQQLRDVQQPPGKMETVHHLPITPSMRESVMQGQPLFSRTPEVPKLEVAQRTGKYYTNAPTYIHMQAAALQTIPLEGRISRLADAYVTNPSGMELIGRAAGLPADYTGTGNVGIHVAPKDAAAMARNLGIIMAGQFPGGLPEAVARLQNALEQAAKNGKSMVLVSDSPSWEKYHSTALAEELSHAVQASLTGKNRDLFGKRQQEFFDHAIFPKAARALFSRYARPGSPEWENPNYTWKDALEVSVRLMRPEGYKELNLSPVEARSLAAHYVKTLRREYGSQSPREIAKEVFDAFRRSGRAQPDTTAVSAGRRGTSVPEQTGVDVSGYRPEIGNHEGEERSGDSRNQSESAPAVGAVPSTSEVRSPESGFVPASALTAPVAALDKALGISKSFDNHIRPIGDELSKSWGQIKTLLAFGDRGPGTAEATGALRQGGAHLDRVTKQANRAIEQFRGALGKLPPAAREDFIDRAEANQPQPTPELQRIADVLHQVNEFMRREVDESDPETQRVWREVYWPNMWKETANARMGGQKPEVPGQGRAPLQGSKAFTKEKVFPTRAEGIAAGFTPLFDNPIDYWKVKIREMGKFAMATRLKSDLAPLAKFVRFGNAPEPGYGKITDKMARVFQHSQTEGGMVYRGDWTYPKAAADIINNHLSPDPRQSVAALKLFADLGNLWLRWKLTGFYHLGTTAFNSLYSHAALGMRYAAQGDMAKALAEFGKAPIGPVADAIKGRKLLNQFLDINGVQTAAFQAMEEGGYRAGQDPFYNSNFRQRLRESWEGGEHLFGPVLYGLPAAAEAIASPIMEKYVPWLKTAAVSDLARFQLEKFEKANGRPPEPKEMRAIMAKAVDSIDNRFGQLTYDNLFWNRMFKAALMIAVMSVGWNLGTLRELGGGAKDALGNLKKLIGKQGPGFTDRIAYLVALNVGHALLAAIYQKLMTGKNPGDRPDSKGKPGDIAKDLAYPLDGGVEANGNPSRTALPDYAKDEAAWSMRPGQTAAGKMHPFLGFTVHVLTNRDANGKMISDEEASRLARLKQIAQYAWGEESLPLSLSNLQKDREGVHTPFQLAATQLGFSPAPSWVDRSAAMDFISNYEHNQSGAQPPSERTQIKNQITAAVRAHDNTRYRTVALPALAAGKITGDDVDEAEDRAFAPPILSGFKPLPLGVAIDAYSLATPQERAILSKEMNNKVINGMPKLPPAQQLELDQKLLRLQQ
jgi:hypothetical protein